MTGVILRISDKGFGFIKGKDDGKDYFFHVSALKNRKMDELKVGGEVEFEPGHGPKGLRAEEIYV